MAPDPRSGSRDSRDNPRRPGAGNPVRALYEIFSDTSFALFVIIALAIASIVGIIIIDQVPFRGEMARFRFADRADDPLVWFLINVVPERPFRSLLFRTLLTLLSLSLFACVIRRWRRQWRQALALPAPREGDYDGRRALSWLTAQRPMPDTVTRLLRRRGFTVRDAGDPEAWFLAGSRFGVARLGSILTHVGFLLLVVGGLVMASSGTSRTVWLGPGDGAPIPGTDAHLELKDFRIETTPRGQVADYISSARLMRDSTLIRECEIEVNRPLRYRGRSIYQSSYRPDPTRVRSLTLVYDMPVPGQPPGPHTPQRSATTPDDAAMPHHAPARGQMMNPVSVVLLPGERAALAGTPYAAEIDTFLIDFRVDGGSVRLGSNEPHNPAARVRFFEGDSLTGRSWYFLRHPEMPVGSGPDLGVRMAEYQPFLLTGLEVATHPGSAWVWAGISVMTLGTLLAFLLRHERIWLRVRPAAGPARDQWELTVVHAGASPQDLSPEREAWQAAISRLTAGLVRRWPPEGGRPIRWPSEHKRTAGSASAADDDRS